VGTRSRICHKGWACGLHGGGGLCCYQVMSKLIIVKAMVGNLLCLYVLCNYTKI